LNEDKVRSSSHKRERYSNFGRTDFFKYRKNKTNFKVILKMYVISYIVLTCSIHYCSLADGTRYEAATRYETWIYTPWWYTLRGSYKLRDMDLHPVIVYVTRQLQVMRHGFTLRDGIRYEAAASYETWIYTPYKGWHVVLCWPLKPVDDSVGRMGTSLSRLQFTCIGFWSLVIDVSESYDYKS